MKDMLKAARSAKGLQTKDLAAQLHLDPALLSKFEKGQRIPTRAQVKQLAEALELDEDALTLAWLTQKILALVQGESLAVKALEAASSQLAPSKNKIEAEALEKLFGEMEALKQKFEQLRG